jgi:hypothetical protein
MALPRLPFRVPGRRPRPVEPGAPYRILFVCSSGGHLAQLVRLRPWWERHERTWVCFDLPDAVGRLAGERFVACHHPTTRNVPNLLRNLLLAVGYFRHERPDVVVSDGAGVAVPFFWLARWYRARTVYLEVYDRVDSATMTARLVEPVCDLFLVQWDEQLATYPEAVVAGPVY